jgi:hypothetical protein
MIMANVVHNNGPVVGTLYYTRFRIYDAHDVPGTLTPNSSENGFVVHECGKDVIDLMQAYIDNVPKSPRKRSLSM